MSDLVNYVNDGTFDDEVLNSSTPVLVDFTATWCGPCKALAPKLDAIASEYAGKARVVKVDIDLSRKTAMAYNVRSVPTLLMFKGGQVTGQEIGNVDIRKLNALVDNAL